MINNMSKLTLTKDSIIVNNGWGIYMLGKSDIRITKKLFKELLKNKIIYHDRHQWGEDYFLVYKYTLGDKITIKDGSIVTKYGYWQLRGLSFTPKMEQFCNKEVTITKVLEGGLYKIAEDNGEHGWIDIMFA